MNSREFNLKDIEKGNIQIINEACFPVAPMALLRYESFVDFYTEEPCNVYVKFHKNDNKCLFEQILRLRVWIPNQLTYSWSIYSSSRDRFEKAREDGLILRYVAWHRSLDVQKLKEANRERKKMLLTELPELEVNNIFLNHKQASCLIDVLDEGDKLVSNGITLNQRSSKLEMPSWKNFELTRMFDWGSVRANWSTTMENIKIEKYGMKLSECLSSYLNTGISGKKIYQMDLDFLYPPEMFKKLIDGSKLDEI